MQETNSFMCEFAIDRVKCDVSHSEQNIATSTEYLPLDCIEAMIRLGWDLST